eukprot:TRINITY_DN26031_c0_g1_i1.p1 TRINITY_DN26031_c0_g1~~TRINITY_DN26031_c0_g1_i1.p1  ORF type:complete len:546 (+),score=161.02 TRINITY_DN26031_c0_g1_i1:58-1638(+)
MPVRRALLVVVPMAAALCILQFAQSPQGPSVPTDSPRPADRPSVRPTLSPSADESVHSGEQSRGPSRGAGDDAGGSDSGGGEEVEWDRAADGVGPLGKLGRRSALREKLERSLCGKCKPLKGPAPSFCSGGHPPQPIFDFPAKPRPSASLPARTPAIFVALGDRLHAAPGQLTGRQDYVEEAIRQWRLFNPPEESDVYLIVSSVYRGKGNVTWQWAREHSIKLVFDTDLERTPEWQRYGEVFYVQGYMHPGGSRKTGNKDFNELVTARFHAVHALMQKEGLEHAVHMENDIMVYARWRDTLDATVRCGARLASTFASAKGVIPSVLYIRDAEAIGLLIRFINGILSCSEPCIQPNRNSPASCAERGDICVWDKKGAVKYTGQCFGRFGQDLNKQLKMGPYANDMTYLLNFWQYYGSAALAPLPAWENKPKENCIWDLRPNEIFDLASIGQWYSFSPPGLDPPRPAKQYVQAMKQGRFLDATPPPYLKWRKDEKGRRVPHWKGMKILSMHVHGKNLWRFRSVGEEER